MTAGARESAVGGHERKSEHFCEGDVGRVVRRDMTAELPDAR